MSENRFKIVFDGALLPGVDITTAKLNLAGLFKSDVTAIERLFSGRTVALKRDLSHTDAQTYLQALSKTGIDARIENEPSIELDLSEVHEPSPARNQWGSPDAESPYAPPRAPVGETLPAFGTLKAFTFTGRIGRLRYLAWTMALMLVLLGVAGVFISIGLSLIALTSTVGLVIGGLVGAALCIAFFVVSIQIIVQRLHDLGWSGWLYLLTLVPFVGGLFPILLAVLPGNAAANQYGAPPPANTMAVKVLCALWVVFIAVVFIGAVTGGIGALQNEYESTTESSYDSGSVITDEVEVEPAAEAGPATDSADEAAEEAPPPVDSAKE
ncbi:hypothetical protein PS662_02336 [Pseudomonas fluorescens]|uniref:DUF805 domain-containing protein n=1 Tax=Pseudomonas fluorescens TaxID=294 RepID=A0A5E6SV70_PSEFL|nr:DUF805 domain-containing protein [Pseudomonas fluorescens]VVM81315.1 hypothetical protein PS662_02336 [Pseudomonas fluorescens]